MPGGERRQLLRRDVFALADCVADAVGSCLLDIFQSDRIARADGAADAMLVDRVRDPPLATALQDARRPFLFFLQGFLLSVNFSIASRMTCEIETPFLLAIRSTRSRSSTGSRRAIIGVSPVGGLPTGLFGCSGFCVERVLRANRVIVLRKPFRCQERLRGTVN